MSCELCDNKYLVEGGVYFLNLKAGVCENCGTIHPVHELKAEYRGMINNHHVFLYIPSFRCEGCGDKIHYGNVPCDKEKDNALALELFAGIPVEIL